MSYRIARSSPLGWLTVEADDQAITSVRFSDHRPEGPFQETPLLKKARLELGEYFSGKRDQFSFPIAFAKGTEFQKKVWRALREIRYGRTCSYGDIAARIGSKGAVRAVGTAIGRNPLPVVVPCHRVIQSTGAIGNFTGGVEKKHLLLRLEKSDALATGE